MQLYNAQIDMYAGFPPLEPERRFNLGMFEGFGNVFLCLLKRLLYIVSFDNQLLLIRLTVVLVMKWDTNKHILAIWYDNSHFRHLNSLQFTTIRPWSRVKYLPIMLPSPHTQRKQRWLLSQSWALCFHLRFSHAFGSTGY